MRLSNWMIGLVVAVLFAGTWVLLNRPVEQDPWTQDVSGLTYTPFRDNANPTNGQEPTLNIFRDEAANRCIDLPIEAFRYRPPASGAGTSGTVLPTLRTPASRYVPTEPGRSADADKIEAVMATWDTLAEKAPVTA